jgi:hypothetical protein
MDAGGVCVIGEGRVLGANRGSEQRHDRAHNRACDGDDPPTSKGHDDCGGLWDAFGGVRLID